MDSIFINALRNINLKNGLVHFELGEDSPNPQGTIKKTTAFKAVMSEADFGQLVSFLDGFVKNLDANQRAPSSVDPHSDVKITRSENHIEESPRRRIKLS